MCHDVYLSAIIPVYMGSIASNIQDFFLRCKLLIEEGIEAWGLITMVFLVAFCAFGLGRISALEDAQQPVSITMAPSLEKPQGMYVGGLYVGSRTGNVYYYPLVYRRAEHSSRESSVVPDFRRCQNGRLPACEELQGFRIKVNLGYTPDNNIC